MVPVFGVNLSFTGIVTFNSRFSITYYSRVFALHFTFSLDVINTIKSICDLQKYSTPYICRKLDYDGNVEF